MVMTGAFRHRTQQIGAAATVAGVIDRFCPRSLSPAAAETVRELVAAAAPTSPGRARAWLFAAGRLAGFAERVGIELSPAVLLSAATIERLILEGCEDVSPATRRTLRTNLRALARALECYPPPAPTILARERAKTPYSAAQIDGYLRLAAAQATRARRLRASALVCLGAGAGVTASELRHVRGGDIVERCGGMLVVVGGARARVVPVIERYQPRLRDAASFAQQRLIIGGRDPQRRNVTDTLSALLSGDPSLPRLEPGRLRATWLVACAEQIGLGAFMQAAGVRCSQRLGDLTARLPAATDAELVALLGGGA